MGVYLKSVHLKNFRGYIDSKVDFDNHLNVIIGRNDAGKSTILEALEIFLNSNQVKMELTDRNVHCSPEDKIEIPVQWKPGRLFHGGDLCSRRQCRLC